VTAVPLADAARWLAAEPAVNARFEDRDARRSTALLLRPALDQPFRSIEEDA
jgi:hypothetical protein